MTHKRGYVVIILAVVGGFFLSVLYVNPHNGQITLSELVLQLSGSRGELVLGHSMFELVSFAMRMIPGWLFEAYMGITIYKHFCTASVYVFSRYTNRKRWYMREVLLLSGNVLLFEAILLSVTIITTLFRYIIQVDSGGIWLLICHFFIQSMWIYTFTMLINILALRVGSSMSYGCNIAIQAILISMLGVKKFVKWPSLLKLNPISHIVLGWHNSDIESVGLQLNSSYANFYLSDSLIMYILGCVIVSFVAEKIISRHDLLVSDSEMGAI